MKLTKAEQYIADYLAAWSAFYPGLRAPTVTRNGSWYTVKWADGGVKSARASEMSRMAERLREMKLIAAGREALKEQS